MSVVDIEDRSVGAALVWQFVKSGLSLKLFGAAGSARDLGSLNSRGASRSTSALQKLWLFRPVLPPFTWRSWLQEFVREMRCCVPACLSSLLPMPLSTQEPTAGFCRYRSPYVQSGSAADRERDHRNAQRRSSSSIRSVYPVLCVKFQT